MQVCGYPLLKRDFVCVCFFWGKKYEKKLLNSLKGDSPGKKKSYVGGGVGW